MEETLSELRPNSSKIILSTLFKIVLVFAAGAALLFFINIVVDFNLIKEGFSSAGISFDFSQQTKFLPVIASVIVFFILFLNYVSSARVRYIFEKDGLKHYQNILFTQAGEELIHYNNIVKVTFEKSSLLNPGKIILDLTGMQKKSMELNFIDNPEQVAAYILKMINEYWASYYAQRSEEYKYERIMNREGF